jgi:threonine/homoserine/homoserine lactone efflux protein
MLEALIVGIGVGVIIALPTGPVGIFIVQRTLLGGRMIGFAAGMGAAVGDVTYAVLLSVGLKHFLHQIVGLQGWFDILIASILIIIGIMSIKKERQELGVPMQLNTTLTKSFFGSMLLNIANPQVIITLSAVLIGSGFGRSVHAGYALVTFCIALLIGSALWWYGFGRWVEWATSKAKPVSHERLQLVLSWALVVIGVLMALWGIARLVHAL